MQVNIAKQEGYQPWVKVECSDTVKSLARLDTMINQLRVARAWLKKELEKGK